MDDNFMVLRLSSSDTLSERELLKMVDTTPLHSVQIIYEKKEGYYVRVIIGHRAAPYYISTIHDKTKPRYWARLSSLLDHLRDKFPQMRRFQLDITELEDEEDIGTTRQILRRRKEKGASGTFPGSR